MTMRDVIRVVLVDPIEESRVGAAEAAGDDHLALDRRGVHQLSGAWPAGSPRSPPTSA